MHLQFGHPKSLSCLKWQPSCHSLCALHASRAPPQFDEREREQMAEISFLEVNRSKLAMDVDLVRQIEHASSRPSASATASRTNDMVQDSLTNAIKATSSLRELQALLMPPACPSLPSERTSMGARGRGGRGRGGQQAPTEGTRPINLNMLQASASTTRLAKLLLELPSTTIRPEEAEMARRLMQAALLPAISKQLWLLDARGVCNIIWAISKLAALRSYDASPLWTLDLALVRKLVEVAADRARLGEIRGQNASNLLYAIAVINEIHLRSHGSASRGQQGLLPITIKTLIDSTCDPTYLYLCGPQSVANSIWALARLGLQPSLRDDEGPWIDAALEHTTPLLQRMEPRQLTTLAWSLVKLGATPDAQFAKKLLSSSLKKLGLFSFRDLAEFSWSLANMGIRPAEQEVRAICRAATSPDNAATGDASGVAGLMYALSRWQIRPPREFLSCLFESWMSPAELGRYNALQITDVIRSLANLGISPPSEAWSVALLNHLGHLLSPEDYNKSKAQGSELPSLGRGTRLSLKRALKTLGLSRRAECYTINAKL